MKKVKLPSGCLAATLLITFAIACIFGYGRCIYKLASCDFKPDYKAEILYGVGICSGLGVIFGYMDLGK